MKLVQGTIVFAAMTFTAAATAQTTLFDNFGPGDTYLTGIGWSIGYEDDWRQGPGFVVAGEHDYLLTSITAAITYVDGNNEIMLSVYDSVGGQPGNLLATSFGTNFHNFGTDEPPPTFGFSGNTVLQGGATYWVVANATDGPGGDELVWNDSILEDIGLHAQKQGADGQWNTFNDFRSAMRVEGALIPAPSALALFAFAAATRTRRRRRN